MAERLTAADLVRGLEQIINGEWEELARLPDSQRFGWLEEAVTHVMPRYYWEVFDVCQSDISMCRTEGLPDTLALAREAIRRRLEAHAREYAEARACGAVSDKYEYEYD